jgi:hypothetical protein
MKERLILSLMVCLGVLGTSLLPTLAQSRSRRYPTNAEIQRIIREFQQLASSRPIASECCGGWEQDDRTAAQKRSLESFVRAWSRVNPDVTTFLGKWVNNDGEILVYPSNRRGRVCVIVAFPGPSYTFGLGVFNNGHIRLSGDLARQALIKQTNRSGNPFLLAVSVDSDNIARANPGSDIYTHPLIPQPPTQLTVASIPAENSRIIQQFNSAGCSALRPARR